MRIKDVFSRDRDRLKGQSKMGMIRAGGANHVAFLQPNGWEKPESEEKADGTGDDKTRSKQGRAEALVRM